jgi:hypothetical protein
MTVPTTATVLSPELKGLLRRVKLGKSIDTLPERLTLARTSKLSHAEFLELVLADEVTRRDHQSATLRARTAKLDPTMTLEAWDPDTTVTYDQALWTELTSLRSSTTPAACSSSARPVLVDTAHPFIRVRQRVQGFGS